MRHILTSVIGIALIAPTFAQDKKPIIIGVEYAYPGGAKTFAQLGVPMAKLYPDSITWGEMQRAPGLPIDFTLMDRFVREYQDAGFRDLVLVLKSKSNWASVNFLLNPVPRPQFMDLYADWVRAVVDRYQTSGKNPMPGLKRPVRFFEIGSEFSSFEPEPAEDYVAMLERARRAARSASGNAIVLHAAFLAPTVFRDKPGAERYAAEFDRVNKRINIHGLEGMRKVLDQHQQFDMVNFHALTDPTEIEPTIKWLRYEMKQRKFDKPIAISDTTPNPLIAWGPATRLPDDTVIPGLTVKPTAVGIVVPPATENDRLALIEYFNRLIAGDRDVTEWTHAYVAADMVKKVVIAAEQGVAFINTAFMEDLTLYKAPRLHAGAGTSAWAGMADTELNVLTQERVIKSLRPSFFAVQQLQGHSKNYDSVDRVKNQNAKVRLYKFTQGQNVFWIAWHETPRLYLPGAKLPSVKYNLETDAAELRVEKMIDRAGQTKPETTTVPVKNGVAELTISVRPVFIFKK
jgi:hypothetical protein